MTTRTAPAGTGIMPNFNANMNDTLSTERNAYARIAGCFGLKQAAVNKPLTGVS